MRSAYLKQEAFDQFNPSVLGLGDLTKRSAEVEAACVVFDLEGFTDFARQVDPHLAIPLFLSEFLTWLFDAMKKEWRIPRGEESVSTVDGIPTYSSFPFFAKFMGDGVLFLWDVAEITDVGICNIPTLCIALCSQYQRDFLPSISNRVSSAPRRLRCGVARGRVYSVGDGLDFVGPCMNIAGRLQKLSKLTFAISQRGFPLEKNKSKEAMNHFLLRKVAIRGIGEGENVYISAHEYFHLSKSEQSSFSPP